MTYTEALEFLARHGGCKGVKPSPVVSGMTGATYFLRAVDGSLIARVVPPDRVVPA